MRRAVLCGDLSCYIVQRLEEKERIRCIILLCAMSERKSVIRVDVPILNGGFSKSDAGPNCGDLLKSVDEKEDGVPGMARRIKSGGNGIRNRRVYRRFPPLRHRNGSYCSVNRCP